MKKFPLYVAAVFVALATLSSGQSPNYQVSSWFMPSNTKESYVVHDFNDSGIVAGTWIRKDSLFVEEARGIFIWRDGVMRKITPAQGGIKSTLSPAEGLTMGNVRISNTRSDGTFLLAAPARQAVPASVYEPARDIDRVVKYVIKSDLKTFPQPVVSATNLGGYLFMDYNSTVGWDREFSGGVTDIADDGTVLGYTSAWAGYYAPPLLWKPQGGYSPRYFSLDAYASLGEPYALDRSGYVICMVGDLNPPEKHFIYDAPLSSVTPGSASVTRFPIRTGFIEPIDGDPNNLIYNRPSSHGPYRAMRSKDFLRTAVWSNRFQNITILPKFQIGGAFVATENFLPDRSRLSRNGHMIGATDQYPNAALAIRKTDGTYTSLQIHTIEPTDMRLKPPFSYSTMGYGSDYLTTPIAINSKRELLCEYSDERGNGFFVLKVAPPAPEITILQGTVINNNLKDNISKRDFGSIQVGKTSRAMVFVIKNEGTSKLTKLRVTLAGRHADDFIIVTRPALSIGPKMTTQFKIAYKPGKVRASNAILRIESNDVNENPFRVYLSGDGIK